MKSEEEFWMEMCIATARSNSCTQTHTPANYANAAVESYKNRYGEFPKSNRDMLYDALQKVLEVVSNVR